jgi:hypothetical protein
VSTFDIEPLIDDDVEEVISVINAAFGFDRTADWYEWKHRSGPWGPSTGVVARDSEGIAGVRLLLPWFVGPGGRLDAHRATEAATSRVPEGRGSSACSTATSRKRRPKGRRPSSSRPPTSNREGLRQTRMVVADAGPARVAPGGAAAVERPAARGPRRGGSVPGTRSGTGPHRDLLDRGTP